MVNGFTSIEQVTDQYPLSQAAKRNTQTSNKASFDAILKRSLNTANSVSDIKFSKHAAMRLTDRDISLSTEQNERLQEGVKKAEQKGIQDSLVLLDSFAFIVNVPTQTVVTAMDKDESLEKVFTNIDGAVIA